MSTPAEPREPSRMRVGDAERNAAADALQEHLASGRLTIDEYADRSAVVATSRTQGEIDAMFTDLPPIAGAPGAAGLLAKPTGGQPVALDRSSSAPALSDTSNRKLLVGIVSAMPFIALILFFVTRQWWFFLLIPLAGAVLGPMIGNSEDDARRDRDRERRRDERDRRRGR